MKKNIIVYIVIFIGLCLVKFLLTMLIGVTKPVFGDYKPLSFKEALNEIPVIIVFATIGLLIYIFAIEKRK